MKIKKALSILMVLALAFALCACSLTTGVAKSSAPAADATPSAVSGSNESAAPAESESAAPATSIEETPLFDEQGISAKAVSLNLTGSGAGPEIVTEITNTTGQAITVQTTDGAVNGIMITPSIYAELQAGETQTASIVLSEADLYNANITDLATIEMRFDIFQTSSNTLLFETDYIKLSTSAESSYTQTLNDQGQTLVDQNNIKVVYLSTDDSVSDSGTVIKLFLQNNSDKYVTVECSALSIGAASVPVQFSAGIAAGKSAYSDVLIESSALQTAGVTDLSQITMSFSVTDTAAFELLFTSDAATINSDAAAATVPEEGTESLPSAQTSLETANGDDSE